ncbi:MULTISPECIES: adenylosuccinate synthetase [unclassified Leeuwenhoekiella]|uniref:adenylosuccinate synthetase n=1 Tax=unclassified Leeuwenhoekiella TaxID=2615029 RepID=UPI000C558581|nr:MULTISPECIES: adenylosuccinate synthetase [unclassified Leeuwenhoekiella]MAW95447.1 adenylosuccinate synthetase [Leeuwenhoekiella sp.]MBA80834.1 adenylosuccinate synthetase [Leeuwenhoekiella sp.]
MKLYYNFFTIFQLPPGTQNPDDNIPVDFNEPFDLIVFVILPVVLIALYIIWRKKRKGRRD